MNFRGLPSVAAALAVAWAGGAASAATGPYAPGTLDDRIDLLVRSGFDRPVEAVAALSELRASSLPSPTLTRDIDLARGLVEAQAGHSQVAGVLAAHLESLSQSRSDPLATAAAELVRAAVADNAGRLDEAATRAQAAASSLERGCPRSRLGGSDDATRAAFAASCDYRSLWAALDVLQRRAMNAGQFQAARDHAQAALDLAEWAADGYRQVRSLGAVASIAASSGQHDIALRTLASARRIAGSMSDPGVGVLVSRDEARLASLRQDVDTQLRATEGAHAMSVRQGARRLAAVLKGDLSVVYLRHGRAADALRVANEGLDTLREYRDQPQLRTLTKQAALAKVALNRLPEGRRELDVVLASLKEEGQTGALLQTLVEYADALSAVGDWRGALEIIQRERALNADVEKRSNDAVSKEMQSRYDAEAKQRGIEILGRENALKTAALANRDLLQRIGLIIAVVLAATLVLATVLYRRVRSTQSALAQGHAKLKEASERDPLTNLANRRRFHALMQALHGPQSSQGFSGGLLLVDIDHFKRINDGHGHAAGDQVLTEVAKRLGLAVESDHLVVRWGGEEFLVHATGLDAEQTDRLAARVLHELGNTAVRVDGQALRITASVGHGCFPLPPARVPLSWEQAVNLCDMALYAAKGGGRNRSVGIVSVDVSESAQLRDIERDFEQARQAGRVTVRVGLGPAP